ncbi:hypothetical protein OG864_00815 [Streptomyces sp. NBC_00124]|uniref:S1 family peptidase n=1 Tax=Streptomyces sp. NBC_00124 TaxID=2975662 RepID=UPI00225984CB|nr:serine protease [Streptomyces sp. NBC_00124]MCX5357324.1 hypothetical protein [Streptomyces sp. NBC_00124]
MPVDERQVAEIKGVAYGSGFRVTSRLLLTSGHVCGPSGTPVQVRFLHQESAVAGHVVWRGDDAGLDAGLVRLDADGEADELPTPRTRFGRFTTRIRGAGCEIWGYPAVLKREHRDIAQLGGVINPGMLHHSGLLQISLRDALPRATAGGSPWSGLSGSAVHSDDGLLIAIVASDPEEFDSGALEAVPVERLVRDSGFRRHVAADLGREPQTESVELALLLSAVDPPAAASPGSLLRAETEAVRFRGRSGMLSDLEDWCTQRDGSSVRLMTGPAGRGKTRLARQLISVLREQGWVAGFLRHAALSPGESRPLGASVVPTLLVIDYAETRPRDVRLVLDAAATGGSGAALRILLLARSAGEWWGDLEESLRDGSSACSPAEPIALGPLETAEEGRQEAFRDAAVDLARRLSVMSASSGTNWERIASHLRSPDVHREAFDSVLALHMSALAALLQAGPDPVQDQPNGSAAEILLGHESRYWKASDEATGLGLSRPLRRRAVAAAALCGGRGEESIRTLVTRIPGLRDASEERATNIAHWLCGLYPVGEAGELGPLQPDVLAEQLIGHTAQECPEFLPALLPAASEEQTLRGLHVLSRAASHQPLLPGALCMLLVGDLQNLSAPAIRAVPRVEYPEYLAMGLTLGIVSCDSPGLLQSLDELIPADTNFLAECAAHLSTTRLRLAFQGMAEWGKPDDVPGLLRKAAAFVDVVRAILNHARRLGQAGDREAAAAWSGQAVELAHSVLQDGSEGFFAAYGTWGYVLVGALVQHAEALIGCREGPKALESARAAVHILRELQRTRTDADPILMPVALSQLAAACTLNGLSTEAAEHSRQCVELLRVTAERDPALTDTLARAQLQLSAVLAADGDAETASGLRDSVAASVAAWVPDSPQTALDLGRIHTQLADAFQGAGRSQEARSALEQAVDVMGAVAESHPDASLLDRVLAQERLAVMVAGDDSAAATEHLEAAVAAWRPLARTSERHRRRLGELLLKLNAFRLTSKRLDHIGRDAEECVEIFRVLMAEEEAEDRASARAGEHRRSLVDALLIQGDVLQTRGALAQAVDALIEAAALETERMSAAAADPGRLIAILAEVASTNPGEEAARRAHPLAARAVELARSSHATGEKGNGQRLASALTSLATMCRASRDHEGARAAAEEALRWAGAADGDGDTPEPPSQLLVEALWTYANVRTMPRDDISPEDLLEGCAAHRAAFEAVARRVRAEPPPDLDTFITRTTVTAQALRLLNTVADRENADPAYLALLATALETLTEYVRSGGSEEQTRKALDTFLALGLDTPRIESRDRMVSAAIDTHAALAEVHPADTGPAHRLFVVMQQLAEDGDDDNVLRAVQVVVPDILRRPAEEIARARTDASLGLAMLHIVLLRASLAPGSPRTREVSLSAVAVVRDLLPLAHEAPQDLVALAAKVAGLAHAGLRAPWDREHLAVWVPNVVDLYRRIEAGVPDNQVGYFAQALMDLVRIRAATGVIGEAATLAGEAVALTRRLASADPDRHLAVHASMLEQLVVLRTRSGSASGPELWAEWVAVTRRRAATGDPRAVGELRRVLAEASRRLQSQGDPESALVFCRELHRLCRESDDPVVAAEATELLIRCLQALRRYAETAALTPDALRLALASDAARPAEGVGALARMSALLTVAHHELGRHVQVTRCVALAVPELRTAHHQDGSQRTVLVQTLLLGARSHAQLAQWSRAGDLLVEAQQVSDSAPEAAPEPRADEIRVHLCWLHGLRPQALEDSWQRATDAPLPPWLNSSGGAAARGAAG